MKEMIEINGDSYPCFMTIGAMMAFKRMTGKEVDDMASLGIEGVATLFFCCVRSACARDKREFPFKTVEELADLIRPGDLTTWEKTLSGGDKNSTGKKKQ